MKIKGYIKSIEAALDSKTGVQRTWTNPEGKVYEFFNAVISIPYTAQNGEKYEDTLVADVVRERVEGSIQPYRDYVGTEKDALELTLICNAKQSNGRYFNSIKLTNASVKAQ